MGAALLLLFLGQSGSLEAPSPPPPAYDAPRLRFGLGVISGVLEPSVLYRNAVLTLLGLEARVGDQLDDHFAVMFEGNATLVWPHFGAAALIEWTPFDFVGVGTGASLAWLQSLQRGDQSSDNYATAGVPIRLTLYLPASRRGNRRTAAYLNATFTPEWTIATSSTTYWGYELGFLAGFGVELY